MNNIDRSEMSSKDAITEAGTSTVQYDHEHDVRPWGTFTVLEEGKHYKVKNITVLPQKRLSYQKHARRCEHWIVVQGSGVVTLNDRDQAVNVGDKVDVPIGTSHRIQNPGPETLIFIEVQRGEYLGEDDIVRLEDDFGRAV